MSADKDETKAKADTHGLDNNDTIIDLEYIERAPDDSKEVEEKDQTTEIIIPAGQQIRGYLSSSVIQNVMVMTVSNNPPAFMKGDANEISSPVSSIHTPPPLSYRNSSYQSGWPFKNTSSGHRPNLPLLNYDPKSRNPFVRQVMSIVLVMMLMTAAVVWTVLAIPELKLFFLENVWFIFILDIILLAIIDYIMILSDCSRRIPCNIILLFFTVVAMSTIAATVTALYDTQVVLLAIIAASFVIFVCLALAFTKFDFTSWMLQILVVVTVFAALTVMVLILIYLLDIRMKAIVLAFLGVGTFLQALVFTVQLQTILGGKVIEISVHDYGLAAFMVYTSILDIFLKMVQIIGVSSKLG